MTSSHNLQKQQFQKFPISWEELEQKIIVTSENCCYCYLKKLLLAQSVRVITNFVFLSDCFTLLFSIEEFMDWCIMNELFQAMILTNIKVLSSLSLSFNIIKFGNKTDRQTFLFYQLIQLLLFVL